VLARTLREHHPEAELRVLVVDAPEVSGANHEEPFMRVTLAGAGVDMAELQRRATMYDPQALVSSLKAPFVGAQLVRARRPVLLLDADMLVLGPLDDVLALAGRHGIVLSPHTSVPLRHAPGRLTPEEALLRAGVMNGGFLAVGPQAGPFLRWCSERSARDCVWDPDRALSLSQTWLTLVPALFDHHVLRDRGVNLMGHGLGGDDVTWEGGAPSIRGRPVRLFHFAGGFDPRNPGLGGPRAPAWWPRPADRPGLGALCERYAALLLAAGWRPADSGDAGDGDELDWAMRAAYRDGLIEAEAAGGMEPPNPFAHGGDAFSGWLAGPRWPGSVVSRYLAALRAGRGDLRAAFPAVPGADEAALAAWAASKQPAGEAGRLPAEALRS